MTNDKGITDKELKQFLEQEYKDKEEYSELLTNIKNMHDNNDSYTNISLMVVFPTAHYLYFKRNIIVDPQKLLELAIPYTEEYLEWKAKKCFNKRVSADAEAVYELWNNYINIIEND